MDREFERRVCPGHLMFITSTVFMIVGFILLVEGVPALQHIRGYISFLECYHFIPVEILIAAGVITIVTSVSGCVAAHKESLLMVNLQALIMCLVIILEISAGVIAYTLRPTISDDIQYNMMNTITNYTRVEYVEELWDSIQKNLHCCGVQDPFDWSQLNDRGQPVTMDGQTFFVPLSCCDNYPFCYDVYKKGCRDALGTEVIYTIFAMTYNGILICLIMMQIVGVIAVFVVARAIRRLKTVQEMERQGLETKIFQPVGRQSESRVVTSLSSFPEPSTSTANKTL